MLTGIECKANSRFYDRNLALTTLLPPALKPVWAVKTIMECLTATIEPTALRSFVASTPTVGTAAALAQIGKDEDPRD